MSTSGNSPVGTLEIEVSPTVPDETASVGIGMSGGSVFAVQAEPGANPRFAPRPQYWITAGTFAEGQVLDVEEITNEAPVPYDDRFSMRAVLGPSDLWTVSAD